MVGELQIEIQFYFYNAILSSSVERDYDDLDVVESSNNIESIRVGSLVSV